MRTRRGSDHDIDHHWGLRLAAGAFGGLAGGLIFGLLMSIPAVWTTTLFAGTGVFTLLGMLLGLDGTSSFHLLYVWMIHMAASILFGLVFALAVPPTIARRASILLGTAWGLVLWIGSLALSMLLVPGGLDIGAAMALNFVGHLLFGATLGFVYPAFDHEEEEVSHGRGTFKPVPPGKLSP